MHHLLLSFAKWLQGTSLALDIAESYWAYPFVQLTHFAGLSIWLATNIALDLHLLGVEGRSQTPAELLRALLVWNWVGFGAVVLGGLMLFSTSASAFIENPAFEIKIGALLPIALAWHIFVQLKTPTWSKTAEVPMVAKVAGSIEILLWVCVVTAAAAIPYF